MQPDQLASPQLGVIPLAVAHLTARLRKLSNSATICRKRATVRTVSRCRGVVMIAAMIVAPKSFVEL
jgi:hypothetical protein